MIYLDYAATTPVDETLARTHARMIEKIWANPSSPHRPGQEAHAALDAARERAAKALGAQFSEIVFTASATEANNLALRGVIDGAYAANKEFSDGNLPEVIVSSIEHASVLETVQALATQKRITLLIAPVDPSSGRADPAWIGSHINPRTVLVSVMWVNNEIGSVQEVEKIADAIAQYRFEKKTKFPLFHTDAVQAFQYFDVNVSRAPIDLLTLAGHKMYAPKGVGLLYIRTGTPIAPHMTGGGQERGIRSGTESVPLAYALSYAMEQAVSLRTKESARLRTLRDTCVTLVTTRIPAMRVLGEKKYSSPHIISFLFDALAAEELLFLLDEAGIAVSLGSACTTGKIGSSHVLAAIGTKESGAALRISMGRKTRIGDIRAFVAALSHIVGRLSKAT